MCSKIPSRTWVALMLFWGTFVNYMFRSHYQISLLAMMESRNNESVEDVCKIFLKFFSYLKKFISLICINGTERKQKCFSLSIL